MTGYGTEVGQRAFTGIKALEKNTVADKAMLLDAHAPLMTGFCVVITRETYAGAN